MTTIITVLTEGYADWETALLNAVARSFYGVETRFATPGGAHVTSSGGLKVTPDLAVEDIDVSAIDALVVNGGSAWSQDDAPDIATVLVAARDAGKVVAGICDATLALAKAGLLDDIEHTSNSAENLPPTGYQGADHYQDQPSAVVAGKIVTAPGTAPVSFMAGVMQSLGLRDGNLDYYLGLHAAEHFDPSRRADRSRGAI
ncbi:Putative intracellular protease/amidase [Devosia sp. YR412]|uniref:DJ-1/PfpI family protein n=1 Tax=Devosia sp. YR412 TaxID=1881030 RepID=UPI0008D73449|nr:DJ-1/PfpI family protein [Devosia sp. YR412]SEQ30025.1 Putative intracellular protease/amidase [Devosia sp. YR412]